MRSSNANAGHSPRFFLSVLPPHPRIVLPYQVCIFMPRPRPFNMSSFPTTPAFAPPATLAMLPHAPQHPLRGR